MGDALTEKATAGDAEAQFKVGTLCAMRKQKETAVIWFKRAAEQGHRGAINKLAKLEPDSYYDEASAKLKAYQSLMSRLQAKRRILFIEWEPKKREAEVAFLRKRHKVLPAHDDKHALRLLQEDCRPGLILTRYRMQHSNALQFVNSIRERNIDWYGLSVFLYPKEDENEVTKLRNTEEILFLPESIGMEELSKTLAKLFHKV